MDQQSKKHVQLMTDVAAMYYFDNKSQDEIARELFVSRSTISRLLKQAREENLVSIKIKFAPGRNEYYENKICDLFHIEAVVINSQGVPEDDTRETICEEFAAWFNQNLCDGDIVGVTRGSLIHHMGAIVQSKGQKNVSFVQLMGTESRGFSQVIAQDVIRQFADQYGGKSYFIDAPLVFFNDEARRELIKVPSIRHTLELAKAANLVLTTLPKIEPNDPNHIWKGFIERETYDEIVRLGGVGCIFGRVFDIEGKFLDIPLNHSIVGADVQALRTKRIAASCYGTGFAKSALGALRGGFVKTLITDTDCAEELLALDRDLLESSQDNT